MSTGYPQQQADDASLGLIRVGPVVLSYPNLFVPREVKNEDGTSKMQYDAEFLIYDDHPQRDQLVQMIYSAIMAVAQKSWGQNWQMMLQRTMASDKAPMRRISMSKSFKPGDKDGFKVKGKSAKAIPVSKKNPASPPGQVALMAVTNAEEAYPGVYVVAELKAHAYSHPRGGDGISWWLNQIALVMDGPRLGQSVTPPEEAFAAFNFDAYPALQGIQTPTSTMMGAMGSMPGVSAPTTGMPGMPPVQPPAFAGMPGMPGPVGMPGSVPAAPPAAAVALPQGYAAPMQPQGMPPQIGMPAVAPPAVQTMPGIPGMAPAYGQAPPQGFPTPGMPGMPPQMGMPQQQPGIQIPGMPGVPY